MVYQNINHPTLVSKHQHAVLRWGNPRAFPPYWFLTKHYSWSLFKQEQLGTEKTSIRPSSKKILIAAHIKHQIFLQKTQKRACIHISEPLRMVNAATEMVLLLVLPVHGYSSLSPGLPGGEQTGLHEGLSDTWPGPGVHSHEGSSAMHLEALRGGGLRGAPLCASSFYFQKATELIQHCCTLYKAAKKQKGRQFFFLNFDIK